MGVSTTLLGTQPPGQADRAVKRDTPFTLVLGGGGMKGLAHVGVLQALLERGHRPTRIIGSSVGALVGAAWAGGMGIAKLREIALDLKRKDVFAVAHADTALEGQPVAMGDDLNTVLSRSAFSQLRSIYAGPGRNLELTQPLLLGNTEFGSIRIGVSTLQLVDQTGADLGSGLAQQR